VVAPSVTTAANNTLILSFFTNAGTSSFTPPAGLTERYDYAGSAPANMMATWICEMTGATGTKTSVSPVYANWIAQQVAVRGICGLKNARIMEPVQETGTLVTENIIVYPNPTRGEVNIDLGIEDPGEVQISILTLQGAEVFHEHYSPANRISLDIAQYKNGVYLVKITCNGGTAVRKIMLER